MTPFRGCVIARGLCDGWDRGTQRAVMAGGNNPRNALRMLAQRLQATRLETRTKESNMLASVWVENPDAE